MGLDMRIVIDMQGAQSTGSRNRGIGRYVRAFVGGLIRNRGPHQIVLALSDLFPETIEPLREQFGADIGQDNIRVWTAPAPVMHLDHGNDFRRRSAELLREAFLASLSPDVVLVTSLFEGLDCDAVTSVGLLSARIPTAAILYDLIPLIHRRPYLENPVVEAWYEDKLAHLRRTDLLLAISESSRRESVEYLGFSDTNTVNVSTAADPQFQPMVLDRDLETAIRQRYGLDRPFVMYTGGIDHRKNIEGLIEAFATLPADLRHDHQLAIVCSVRDDERLRLETLANRHGLGRGVFVMTGFVPEDDLIALYNLCKLFVFPSWHEGFGLPALEAMSCGRAVIGSNVSSVPEVIGRDDALFDPRDVKSLAGKMQHVLSDEAFRHELEQYGLRQARTFSWDSSARRAIAAMENIVATQPVIKEPARAGRTPRPKLAYVSPLPPLRSGIADYSAELLPELNRHYDIDVIIDQPTVDTPFVLANCPMRSVDWFRAHSGRYDRVLYHFGNSEFHGHMFDLLEEVPGTVVLHDFFLSGILHHMSASGSAPGVFARELYHAHGYPALRDLAKTTDVADVFFKYPCSRRILELAQGVIVHSESSLRLAEQWYGPEARRDLTVIPHLRSPTRQTDRMTARRRLGIGEDAFILCSFGVIAPTKMTEKLLDAWLESELFKDERCHLVLVGQNHPGDYGEALVRTIRRHGVDDRVRITGWADRQAFTDHLAAADMAVQLRTLSRGETSGTALDCMNYGLATIVNANGSMADLPDDAVLKLPDEFAQDQLVAAMEQLRSDGEHRRRLQMAARNVIIDQHAPKRCADLYADAIEGFHLRAMGGSGGLARSLASLEVRPTGHHDWLRLADAAASAFAPHPPRRQILVDISTEVSMPDAAQAVAEEYRLEPFWLESRPDAVSVEPVYFDGLGRLRYARKAATKMLNGAGRFLDDAPVECHPGDVLVIRGEHGEARPERKAGIDHLVRRGIAVTIASDPAGFLPAQQPADHAGPRQAAQGRKANKQHASRTGKAT